MQPTINARQRTNPRAKQCQSQTLRKLSSLCSAPSFSFTLYSPSAAHLYTPHLHAAPLHTASLQEAPRHDTSLYAAHLQSASLHTAHLQAAPLQAALLHTHYTTEKAVLRVLDSYLQINPTYRIRQHNSPPYQLRNKDTSNSQNPPHPL